MPRSDQRDALLSRVGGRRPVIRIWIAGLVAVLRRWVTGNGKGGDWLRNYWSNVCWFDDSARDWVVGRDLTWLDILCTTPWLPNINCCNYLMISLHDMRDTKQAFRLLKFSSTTRFSAFVTQWLSRLTDLIGRSRGVLNNSTMIRIHVGKKPHSKWPRSLWRVEKETIR